MIRLFLLLFPLLLSASPLDFWHIKKADEAYKSKEYKKAAQNYKKLDSDEAKYDLANSYYKMGEYKKAIELYNGIEKKSLQFKKLHNLGNSLAQSGKVDEAIKAYEEALKIKEDKDTKFNLELLKRKKKQQKKQNKNKKNQDNKNKKDKKQNKDSKNSNKDKRENKKSQNKNKQDKKEQKPKQNKQKQKDKSQPKQAQKKQKELSDMQERKYIKMLNKKGINTLLLPLDKKTKGENHEENPW